MAAKDLRSFAQEAKVASSKTRLLGSGCEQVLRFDGGFVCGQCNELFGTFVLAFGCLQRCTLNNRLRTSVNRQASSKGDIYVCSVCSKRHVYKQDAQRCSENCQEKIRLASGVPHLLLTMFEELKKTADRSELKRTRGPLFNPTRQNTSHKIESRQAQKGMQDLQIEIHKSQIESSFSDLMSDVSDSAILKNADEITIDEIAFSSSEPDLGPSLLNKFPEATPSLVAEPAFERSMDSDMTPEETKPQLVKPPKMDKNGDVLSRKPHMKPFKRADAKYVCTVCSTKFFTQGDVEACFMSHPLDDLV